jgi:hypothetical protein
MTGITHRLMNEKGTICRAYWRQDANAHYMKGIIPLPV